DCIFSVIGACARTAGAARVVPAAAAPPTAEFLRNFRREIACLVMSSSLFAIPASMERQNMKRNGINASRNRFPAQSRRHDEGDRVLQDRLVHADFPLSVD